MTLCFGKQIMYMAELTALERFHFWCTTGKMTSFWPWKLPKNARLLIEKSGKARRVNNMSTGISVFPCTGQNSCMPHSPIRLISSNATL